MSVGLSGRHGLEMASDKRGREDEGRRDDDVARPRPRLPRRCGLARGPRETATHETPPIMKSAKNSCGVLDFLAISNKFFLRGGRGGGRGSARVVRQGGRQACADGRRRARAEEGRTRGVEERVAGGERGEGQPARPPHLARAPALPCPRAASATSSQPHAPTPRFSLLSTPRTGSTVCAHEHPLLSCSRQTPFSTRRAALGPRTACRVRSPRCQPAARSPCTARPTALQLPPLVRPPRNLDAAHPRTLVDPLPDPRLKVAPRARVRRLLPQLEVPHVGREPVRRCRRVRRRGE